jgi:hypothetical protein
MRVSLFILVKSLVVLGRETIRTMTECVTCVSPGSYVCQSYSANSFSMCCSEQNDWNTSGCIKSRAYDCSYEIDSTELQHFMCPFEKEWCGSSTKIQPSLYEAGTQAVTGAKYKFTQGSVCTWEISANRVNFDYIKLQLPALCVLSVSGRRFGQSLAGHEQGGSQRTGDHH